MASGAVLFVIYWRWGGEMKRKEDLRKMDVWPNSNENEIKHNMVICSQAQLTFPVAGAFLRHSRCGGRVWVVC